MDEDDALKVAGAVQRAIQPMLDEMIEEAMDRYMREHLRSAVAYVMDNMTMEEFDMQVWGLVRQKVQEKVDGYLTVEVQLGMNDKGATSE